MRGLHEKQKTHGGGNVMNPVIMSNSDYHAEPAISKSDLDLIAQSPLHYATAKAVPREQTPAMLLGSVTHKLVLEPEEFGDEYAVAPVVNKRTKLGKEAWAQFCAEACGKAVIDAELYSTAKVIADNVRRHPVASKLLQGGQAELSYFWERDGIRCKCRPDYLRTDIKTAVDFKTTQCSAPDKFTKSAYDYRYHVQAAWYLDGLRACGVDVEHFIFIAVETKEPYTVMCYAADDLMIQLGRMTASADFETYKNAVVTENWHGYEEIPEIHSLSLPDWVARKYF